MRFRVPNNGGQRAADGVGNFFRSLAMAPMYEAQAAQQAQDAGLKRDLTQSQIGVHLADAAIKEQERKTLAGRPDILSLMGATRAGMSVPEFQAGLSERIQGAPVMGPPVLSAPIEGVGPSGRTSAFDDAILSLYGPAMATPADKTNWDQLAKARGEYQDQGAMGDALAAANGGDYMKSSALSAVRGKKEFTPFKAVGNTGTALNEITGEQPVTNQGMNVLFGDEGRALVSQRQAAAGASGAAAGASRALASLRGTQTTNEKIKGGLSALDFQAAQEGKPLPSSNKGTSGSSATNSKFRNQIILAAMRKPEFSVMNQAEKSDYINTELMVAGMDPIVPGELAGLPVQGNPQAQAKGPGPIDAKAAGSTAGAAAKKQPDMTKAAAVKADYKAGKLTKEQARAKLQQLGFE